MDRNTTTGILLLLALFIIYTMFFMPEQEPMQGMPAATDSSAQAVAPSATDTTAPPTQVEAPTAGSAASQQDSSSQQSELEAAFGPFAPFATGEERVLDISTELLQVQLSTKGGGLKSVILAEHKSHYGEGLQIWPDSPANYLGGQFVIRGERPLLISTRELYYTSSVSAPVTVQGEQQQTISLVAQLAPGKRVEHRYTFYGNRYHIDYQLVLVGLDELIRDNDIQLNTQLLVPNTEKNVEDQRNKTTIYYREGDEVDNMSASSSDPEEEKLSTRVDWFSFKSQFFTVGFLAQEGLQNVRLRTTPKEPIAESPVKQLAASMTVPYTRGGSSETALRLYMGPNDRYILDEYGQGFKQQVSLGWFIIGIVNKVLILPLFKLLEGSIASYGIIILILAAFIKLILSPLTHRSYMANAKMQVVNKMPEVKALEEKYKNDPTKLQQEKMSISGEFGVSPLSGCMPMLLQMPILFAMFTFFPQSIELRQASFLWADDLSTYDSIWNFGFSIPLLGDHLSGFALLMSISQLIYTYISQRNQATPVGPAAQMRYIAYIMPFVFFTFLNSYSSGLSWYYLVINILTIAQTLLIKATINEDKLHEKLLEMRKQRKAKGVKKSGIAGWLEKQQAKQEEMLKAREQNMKGQVGRQARRTNRKKR